MKKFNFNYRVSTKKIKLILIIIDFVGFLIYYPFNKLISYLLGFEKYKTTKTPKKILITRLDNIGDMVLTSSFILNLKKNYPNSKIILLCRPIQKKIIKNLTIDEFILYDAPWVGGKDSYISYFLLILKYFKYFDLSFELHGEVKSILLTSLISKYSLGFSIRGGAFLLNNFYHYNWNSGLSIVEHQFNLLKLLKLNIFSKELNLGYSKKLKINFKNKKKICLIHPGASLTKKEIGIYIWFKLINKLKNNYNVIVVDTDLKRLKKFKFEFKHEITIYNLNIEDFMALVNNIDILIGLDSLSTHLSAALGKYTIAIHSDENPIGLMYPYSDKSYVIRVNNLKLLNYKLILKEVNKIENLIKNEN